MTVAFAAVVVANVATFAMGAGVEGAFDLVTYNVLSVVLAGSAVLILRRHPGHGTGRLFLALGCWLAVTELADAYGLRAAESGWPAGEYGEWLISWSWIGEFTLWALILMTFPDGRLLSRRWRLMPTVLLIGAALAAAGFGLGTDDLNESFAAGLNPLAVDGLPTLLMFDVGMPLILLATGAAVVSLIVRFRRSHGIERQQLKWFAAAAALVGAMTPVAVVWWYEAPVVQVAMGLAYVTVPLAAAVAILRYRLYDLDLIVNRALVYTGLTATLVAAYLLTVLVSQLVLPERSDLGVAVSTLAAAAVFAPARRRIQAAVDRRFFRRRYDAELTLRAFATRLRDEVDLGMLSDDLRGVVAETVQPAHISLWLRGAP